MVVVVVVVVVVLARGFCGSGCFHSHCLSSLLLLFGLPLLGFERHLCNDDDDDDAISVSRAKNSLT